MSEIKTSAMPIEAIPVGDKYVVGISPFSFKNKKGEEQHAVSLFIATGIPEPGQGVSVDRVTIFGADASEFYLGRIRTVLYEPTYGDRFRCTGVLYE